MNIARGVNQTVLVALSFAVVLTYGCGGSTPKDPPEISFFNSNPSQITFGETSALTWSVSNAKSLSISSGVGVVTGSSITVNPASTTSYTLTATGDGGTDTATTTVAVKTIADTLTYTDPLSGNYRLIKNTAKSSDSHLVLSLIGPTGSVSGVGFCLSANQNSVIWTTVDPGDTERVQNTVFSDALIKSKITGNTLEAGIYQKGTIAPAGVTASTVLANVALDLKSGALITNPPTVNLNAISGKAVILNPPGSAAPTTSISIATGILVAN